MIQTSDNDVLPGPQTSHLLASQSSFLPDEHHHHGKKHSPLRSMRVNSRVCGEQSASIAMVRNKEHVAQTLRERRPTGPSKPDGFGTPDPSDSGPDRGRVWVDSLPPEDLVSGRFSTTTESAKSTFVVNPSLPTQQFHRSPFQYPRSPLILEQFLPGLNSSTPLEEQFFLPIPTGSRRGMVRRSDAVQKEAKTDRIEGPSQRDHVEKTEPACNPQKHAVTALYHVDVHMFVRSCAVTTQSHG